MLHIQTIITTDERELPALVEALAALSRCTIHEFVQETSQPVDVEIMDQDERVKAAEPVEATIVGEQVSEPAAIEVPDESVVVAALREFATAKGLPAATELLAEFNAKRVGDINPEQRAAFVARTQAVSA